MRVENVADSVGLVLQFLRPGRARRLSCGCSRKEQLLGNRIEYYSSHNLVCNIYSVLLRLSLNSNTKSIFQLHLKATKTHSYLLPFLEVCIGSATSKKQCFNLLLCMLVRKFLVNVCDQNTWPQSTVTTTANYLREMCVYL